MLVLWRGTCYGTEVMRLVPPQLWKWLALGSLGVACNLSPEPDLPSAGNGTGGSLSGTGGASATGGSPGTGGGPSTGTGGTDASGGASSAGGSPSSGGVAGAAGAAGEGSWTGSAGRGGEAEDPE